MTLLVILCGLLDRVRGDKFDLIGKGFEKIVYGWVIAHILGHSQDWWTVYIIISFAAGMSTGWGQPIGEALNPGTRKRYHWYEVGILKDDPWLSLMARGFIAGSLLLPFFPQVSGACMVAFPMAVYIAKLTKSTYAAEHQEYYRGWIIGGLLVFTNFLYGAVGINAH